MSTNQATLRAEQHLTPLPSDRVRELADSIAHAWVSFTDEERADLLVLINRERAPLDAPTVAKMLAATNGNISVAAKNLGVSRPTLQKRMHDFGMPPGKAGRRFK